jgi:DNA-binding protein HU-beta
MKKNTYNKATLVRELAFSAGITQKKARFVLDALTYIAYREAADEGFTIPGICRLDIIRRKARKMKNPQTGETILIAEHDALRVRALTAARNAVTPTPENLVTVLPHEAHAAALEDFSKAVSFCCKKCSQEIEAPHAAIGAEAQCPACGVSITIPAESEPGTLHGPPAPAAGTPPPLSAAPEPAAAPAAPEPAPTPVPAADQKSRGGQTIRIDLAALGFASPDEPAGAKALPPKRMLSFFCKNCRQEIEAPADMAGTASECPSCGVSFEVPFFSDPGTLHGSDLDNQKPDAASLKDARARTIRIEVPDEF